MSILLDDRRRLIAADRLAQRAAAIRAEREAIATAQPIPDDASRAVLPVLDDLLVGVTEYARHFDWVRA